MKQKKVRSQIATLLKQYGEIPPQQWQSAAADYAAGQEEYHKALCAHRQELETLRRQMEENRLAIAALTGELPLSEFETRCREAEDAYRRLEDRQRQFLQAQEILNALQTAQPQAAPPTMADTLTYSAQETAKRLSDAEAEQRMLQQRLGQCQGQMQSLGEKDALRSQKQALADRIAKLELYYSALVRAQNALQLATQELQRRFAPKISQRAQELFASLTEQRYQKLSLGRDLSLEALAEGENTLRGTLWRSDGTVDQLYLSLRLAVAEELTPHAPLILDDALVRFDDARLKAALNILRQAGEHKQVILFTCQSRETNINREVNHENH